MTRQAIQQQRPIPEEQLYANPDRNLSFCSPRLPAFDSQSAVHHIAGINQFNMHPADTGLQLQRRGEETQNWVIRAQPTGIAPNISLNLEHMYSNNPFVTPAIEPDDDQSYDWRAATFKPTVRQFDITLSIAHAIDSLFHELRNVLPDDDKSSILLESGRKQRAVILLEVIDAHQNDKKLIQSVQRALKKQRNMRFLLVDY